MALFQNILVALDIDQERIADTGLAAAAQALELARREGASVTFAHVFDVGAGTQREMLEVPASAAGRHRAAVQALLDDMVAKAPDVHAQARILFGTHWRELVLEVQRAAHDLVVIGTKRRGVAGRVLFGSTGNKLLRACPCPVWVVKARSTSTVPRVLVAHDLSEVGQAALAIAAAVTALEEGELHVLHVLEHPESSHFLGSVNAQARADRKREAQEQLVAQCRAHRLAQAPVISVAEGSAYAAILDYVRTQGIDLLLMGTVARSGLSALLTGNTAENVLPWADCSLIALKPADFVAPVTP